MIKKHLDACPSNSTHRHEDCSCEKESGRYISLAKWSLGLFIFEFIGGLFSGSMALMSDSLHVLLDGTENILSAFISKLSQKNFDEMKARKIGGKISAALLLAASVIIIYEGIGRILMPQQVEWWMVIVAKIGLCVNLWQRKIHHEASLEHHNITYFWQDWHLLSDISASIAVIVGGVIMLATRELYWIDGILSVIIGLLIFSLVGMRLLEIDFHRHT